MITQVTLHEDSSYSAVISGKRLVGITTESRFYTDIQDWIADGNTPDPEFTALGLLANAKEDKIRELKQEGLGRIQLVLPGITNWDTLELERERWLSLEPSARNATFDYQTVIDTYQAGRSAAQDIKLFTDVTDVNNYDVITSPSWP